MTRLVLGVIGVAMCWPKVGLCQDSLTAVKVDTSELYPEERKAFEECAPRLTTDEQKEFVALTAALRSDWLTYRCTGLHDRFEACKPQLSPEQQEAFLKLKNEERGAWLDWNCFADAAPATEAQPAQVVELTGPQLKLLESCGTELTKSDKVELAATEPADRDEWLLVHCDDIYVFALCSPALTVKQQKQFFALKPVERRPWLRSQCGATIKGDAVEPIADGEGDDRVAYHMMPAYNACRTRLSDDQRAEFLELPPNQRFHWLETTCGNAIRFVSSPTSTPVYVDTTPVARRRGPGDYGWPTSRIVAHATFWPGLLVAIGGVIPAIILEGEVPWYWAPPLAAGGALMFTGMIAAVSYSQWKKERRLALTPLRDGTGLAMVYGAAFSLALF